MSFAARDRWVDVVVEQREAMARLRLVRDELSPAVRDIGAEVIVWLSSYSRFSDSVRVSQLVELTGYTRQTVSRALNQLSDLNVIAWRAGVALAKSFVALAQKYLPGSPAKSDPVANVTAAPTLNVTTVVTPEREVFNEKKETTRERDPLPDVNNSDSVPSDDETLSPEETQEVLAALASSELSQHLFHGLPDRWTRTQMYRRFCRVPMEYLQEVLADSLRGKPARTVDCPHAYAVAWISTAERNVQQRHGQLLTTSPAKG